MRMWFCLLTVASTVALGAGEKLGDIEVITRDELGNGGLIPPNKENPFEDDTQTQTRTDFQNSADDNPENRFIPLPALSYLPPVQTPLPIESTAAPQLTSTVILKGEYIPPKGVADEIQPVVETPNTLYNAPKPETANDVIQPIVSEPIFNTQGHSEGHVLPVTGQSESFQPEVGIQDENYYLEDDEAEKPGFLSGIRDSKLALLGGIVGAKSAVFQGFSNAKESLYSGVTGALAAKAAAFSSLKGKGGSYGGGSNAGSSYGAPSAEGYETNPNIGFAGAENSPNYPQIPGPQTPAPAYAPVTTGPALVPLPVSAYPAYPPYPPPQLEPVYAPPRPIYRPLPIANKKASISAAISRAIAKLKAPFQPRFRHGYRQW